ncbi:uncharacterized protein LOC128992314 [Macrosteles quadrilineatus]|uniref:uncharacterized protein LOC128992314 n=1 Tax=Macrosteles quadrilineatus TaxID=74068 RepID=UPI0023E1A306|nr:uncharacterized protein LOC128992314 [Macrosteles quadrilineatus]
MVLNGKAELAARVAKAAKCRYEQLELCGIVTVLSLALVLSYQLYLSMVDDWQEIPQQRWRVLMLSLTLLLMSIATCLYMCRRLQPIVRLPPPPRTLTSVNSQLFLITGERPPSYDSITKPELVYVPPPPYNAIFDV